MKTMMLADFLALAKSLPKNVALWALLATGICLVEMCIRDRRLLDAQGINLDASFSVKSVGNCTYLYAPAQGEKRKRLLA